MEVLQVALHKQAVIATLCQLVVEFQDVSVKFGRSRRGESEGSVIETVTKCVAIG